MPVGDPVAAAQAMSDAASTGFAEPLSRGNAAYAGTAGDSGRSDADDSSEGLAAALRRAPKPSLVALAGLVFIAISVLLSFAGGRELIVPLAVAVGGIGLAWSRLTTRTQGKLPSMLGGIVLLFVGYAIFVFTQHSSGAGRVPSPHHHRRVRTAGRHGSGDRALGEHAHPLPIHRARTQGA